MRLGAEPTTSKRVGRGWNSSEREIVGPTAPRNILLHKEISRDALERRVVERKDKVPHPIQERLCFVIQMN